MLVDHMNSSLTNVCSLSISTYAEQGSYLEDRRIAKCLTIAFCEYAAVSERKRVLKRSDVSYC